MLSFHDNLKIVAYTQPTDMRKGIIGLSGIIREQLQFDPATEVSAIRKTNYMAKGGRKCRVGS